jgi:Ala-tRNA(Pro) deacylase
MLAMSPCPGENPEHRSVTMHRATRVEEPQNLEAAMPLNKVKSFLNAHGTKYVAISHSKAFTAQGIAAISHISGRELAKAVIVKLDGDLAMAVLPASYQVDLELLRRKTGVRTAELATEREFKQHFPDCETGAMPPFGNLYGIPVYVDETLVEDREIAFNAGSHYELIKMKYADFEQLVKPEVMQFSSARAAHVMV